MSRKKGSDQWGFKNFQPKKSEFGFQSFKGRQTKYQLLHSQPIKERFRPDFNMKDQSVLFDYNYSSLWTRWRRGYELYMYANQAYVGLNYSFRYFVSDIQGLGPAIPGAIWMYPSQSQDMAMWQTIIRPRDIFNFLDYGISIVSYSQYSEGVLAVIMSQEFSTPITNFYGEVLANRFAADGTQRETYGNFTVVGFGFNGVPVTGRSRSANVYNTIFVTNGKENSWTVINQETLAAPAIPPTPGTFFSTSMRFSCTCPDYQQREQFNLYKYSQQRLYPYTRPQDLKPGSYDQGNSFISAPDERLLPTRDDPGYTRDFGFMYLKNILNLPTYDDSAVTYSDPSLFFYLPRFCKHIYASFWDLQNRVPELKPDITPWLAQPTDEPLDPKYREYFYINLQKSTDQRRRDKDLYHWEKYSPAIQDVPTHMLYPDGFPAVVKALNYDQLASGVEYQAPLTASGFLMNTIQEYNPFVDSPQGDLDGGRYEDGVLIPASGTVVILDGGRYANGVLIPYPSVPTTLNGGVY